MADDTDVLIKFYEEDWQQARQAEDQRTAITNITLIIVPALIGFVSQKSFDINALPLTVLLIVLGVYGAVASQKLYERHRYFSDRAGFWRNQISKLHPQLEIDKIRSEAAAQHTKHFRRTEKLRLYLLWLALHLLVAAAGVILTIMILI
jgi:uncharacterized membrane protein YeaQ/YmgE (transglycosylase-associated protein family)